MENIKFVYGQELEVKGNAGVCIDRGVVKVVAVLNSRLVDRHLVDAYTDGLAPGEILEIKNDPWYAVEYTDVEIGENWGVMYFPEFSLIDVLVK